MKSNRWLRVSDLESGRGENEARSEMYQSVLRVSTEACDAALAQEDNIYFWLCQNSILSGQELSE